MKSNNIQQQHFEVINETHLTFNMNQLNPHFYHNIIGIVDGFDDEIMATVIDELYEDEIKQKEFKNRQQAIEWAIKQMNIEINYYTSK